jgi:hypothetical protein
MRRTLLYCVYCGFLLAAFAAGFVVFHVDTRATAGDQSTAKSFRNGLQGHDFKRAQAARIERFRSGLGARRRPSIHVKHHEPRGERSQQKSAI